MIFFDNGQIQVYDTENTHGLITFDSFDETVVMLSFHDLEQIYLKANAFYEDGENEE